jgi:cell division protein FtsL
MNRRKSSTSLGFPSLVLLIIAVVIVSSGGIGYVIMKNKQLTARSKIAAIQREMDEHKVSITLYQSDIEETLGYYRLRRQLAEMKSPLVEIKYVEVCETPDEQTRSEGTIAAR